MNKIEETVNEYLSRSKPEDRYTSFDYCYNYYLTTEDLTKDIEKSCLILGFYLASWGMYRGSGFLLQKSIKYFEPLIIYIASLEKDLWEIDIDKYDDKNISIIIDIYNKVKSIFIPHGHSDLTLITKILLGVFGFIPAFDNFFTNTFRQIYKGKCGFRKVNHDSLSMIKDFYDRNKNVIDNLSCTTYTTDFYSGSKTGIRYTKAKIIDMYGFTMGLKKYEIQHVI